MLADYLSFGGSPYEDRWYTRGNTVQMEGSSGGTEGALKISTVWRAVNVLGAAIGVIPMNAMRREKRENVENGYNHSIAWDLPIHNRMRLAPNGAQTSFRWRHQLVGQLMLGGNYYAQKLRKYRGGEIEGMWPLDPSRMEIANVTSNGSIEYAYTQLSGEKKPMTQDDVFHVRGFSLDGFKGISVIEMMQQTVLQATMARVQRTAFLKNGMMPSLVVEHPKELSDTAHNRLLGGMKRALGGPAKAGEFLILEEGAKANSFGFNFRDSQFVESDAFSVEEFLRFTGVPGVLVGHADKTSTHASAEQFFQSFVTYSIWPITGNLEQEMTVSIFGGDQHELYWTFVLDALLRPDSVARAAFYQSLVMMGILTRNEVRELENRNPIEGLDEPLTPVNMGGANPGDHSPNMPPGAPKPGQRKTKPAPPPAEPADPSQQAATRARAVIHAAAARVVRKEILAIVGAPGRKGSAVRYAQDPAAWREWLQAFYDEHAALVSDALQLGITAATGYCKEQLASVLADGLADVETWEKDRVAALERLALAA